VELGKDGEGRGHGEGVVHGRKGRRGTPPLTAQTRPHRISPGGWRRCRGQREECRDRRRWDRRYW
jgi:hypothetical protein